MTLPKEVSSRKLRVTKQQFIMALQKLNWVSLQDGTIFEDIEKAGFVLADREILDKIVKIILEEMPWQAEEQCRKIEKLLVVKP